LAVELSLDRAGEQASAVLDDGGQLIAPPLLWSEVPSVLHEMAFRGDISNALAELALQRFLAREAFDQRATAGRSGDGCVGSRRGFRLGEDL
jgi:hypothetical protein